LYTEIFTKILYVVNILVKILISQQEYVKPPRNFVLDALERAYYDFLVGHQIVPVANNNKAPENDYDCLVLTGGPDSVARNQTENMLYDHAMSEGKPIIGICHGAFVINELAGGVNGSIEGHVDKDHYVTMGEKIYTVNSYHTQMIERLPKDFVSLAEDKDGNPEAFRHKSLSVFGVVWHPERMSDPVLPDAVRDILSPAV
jgi:GMP synthase-like glutamine amidotransferase